MGCGCGGKGRQTTAAAEADSSGGGSGYVYEVTHTDSTVERYDTEGEALAALATRGGGLRMVPRPQ